ncbi:hypothetical protein QBL02_04995 [Leucobacter sp. UT-8R-CII-1-4]|uniref:hypothetical protein n=1 Tax=Leucobacter sp. UT-8R-CII-1-4 TaxID=3040075 RepID=UPI0024A9648F|nr:hypothetical protein [Leucobacter sp. UT-8R-CII-1-4]MDI6022897.1 hypothetical protein [Leucobacter sp. UT-8R-CII-1-4]
MYQRRFAVPARAQMLLGVLLCVAVFCGAALIAVPSASAASEAEVVPMNNISVVSAAPAALLPLASPSQAGNITDADGDAIPDDVELAICGSKTCATGLEDADNDGIADWVEILSCGSRSCASATKDRDGDGIPDYAERLVCGTDACSNSLEDADGDGVADWVEFVVCGTRSCATGFEDYDGGGVSDAAQLAACVKRIDPSLLALTGQPWFWLMLLLGLAGLGTGGWLLWRRGISELAAASPATEAAAGTPEQVAPQATTATSATPVS